MTRGTFLDGATADEINALLFLKGLRPCPHSHHSHDEEFAECARRKRMNMTFTKEDHKFLKSVGISTEPTHDDLMLALAQRIAKHQAPAQVKVDPQEAKRQLIRLSLQKLLNASEDTNNKMNSQNRCRRPNGTPRAYFATAAEAVAFAENPTNTAYHGDVAVLCLKSGCGGWHLSQPHWPDARAAEKGLVN